MKILFLVLFRVVVLYHSTLLFFSLLTHKKVARYLLIQLNSSYVGVVLVGIYIYLSEIRAW